LVAIATEAEGKGRDNPLYQGSVALTMLVEKYMVMEIWFKVLEKSWKPTGQHVYEPCRTFMLSEEFPRSGPTPTPCLLCFA